VTPSFRGRWAPRSSAPWPDQQPSAPPAQIHARSTQRHRWLVVLDAAAFAPTHPLNLTQVKPDFVPLSFYKMVGLPTGVGALLMRRDAAAALHVVYFGGGSVLDATAEGAWRMLMPLPEGLETGTMPFLDIIQLKHGFGLLNGQLGGMKVGGYGVGAVGGLQVVGACRARAAGGAAAGCLVSFGSSLTCCPNPQAISAHVEALREWTWEQLSALRHANGAPLLRIFGAHGRGGHAQSCLFQFLVLRANGSAHGAPQVQKDASDAGLHLRAGERAGRCVWWGRRSAWAACGCGPGQALSCLQR
jgi:molybdenum cofactor sulfurtransferase